MRYPITKLIVIFSLLFSSKYVSSQKSLMRTSINKSSIPNNECGTVTTPESNNYMTKFSQINRATEQYFLNKKKLTSKSVIQVPIKAHIVRTSTGTGGLSLADLNAEIAIMNNHFIDADLQFYLCGGINYIDNSTYYDFDTNDEARLLVDNDVSENINIYFFNTLPRSCGYTRILGSLTLGNIGSNIIMIANNCATNGSTLSHEMGHFFGLDHTHEGRNELVDGSNCTTHGDKICDTPADPNLNRLVDGACLYIGTVVDANGQTYNPDTRNIMSFSEKICRNLFSPQQYARMNTVAKNSALRNNYSCKTTTLPENTLKNQVHIYPNPNQGTVNIELENLSNVSIKVLDVNGRTVLYKENIESKIYQFELHEASGVYFIEVFTENKKQEFKLLIQK